MPNATLSVPTDDNSPKVATSTAVMLLGNTPTTMCSKISYCISHLQLMVLVMTNYPQPLGRWIGTFLCLSATCVGLAPIFPLRVLSDDFKQPFSEEKCRERGSNPHAFMGRRILSPVCLPFPPPRHRGTFACRLVYQYGISPIVHTQFPMNHTANAIFRKPAQNLTVLCVTDINIIPRFLRFVKPQHRQIRISILRW